MMRLTWIGEMFRRDPAAGRAAIIRAIRRNRGNLKATARELDIGRRHLFKLVWRESLWSEIDKVRVRYPRTPGRVPEAPVDWLERTRAALKKGA